ncbi:putative ribosome-binding factor A, mitochondrial isoform X2 [Chionomys nivalis]|uniref:putative ribosome-binding factor A, mitochondrial isoform X2 n=1 Tax=Chionomys nivalis TaxID=269649 RepID=UPI0025940B05|nr:putative ribosome-binding factor A, mitochondrial isoform X2 [Chionomys nivalis]
MWAGAAGLRGSCARLQTLRGGHGAALLSGGAQALHTSVASCGSKNLLKKFASKTRKKFWYEGPSLGSHLTQKPSRFEFLTKSTLRKARKEDTIRLRALNGLLYKAVTELLCTPEVSQEVYDLNVEISKVSVTSDFSACRVYWKIGVSADLNRHTEAVLQRSAAYIRSPEGLSSHNALEPATPPNLCGIDHEALNKQIMEYKRKKEKGLLPCMSLVQLSGQGPLPDVTLLRRRKKTSSRQHRDASPRSVSLGEDEDEDEDSSTEYECQAHEAEEEWEAEARSDGVQQGLHGQREQGQG